jgi:hypothetical protein
MRDSLRAKQTDRIETVISRLTDVIGADGPQTQSSSRLPTPNRERWYLLKVSVNLFEEVALLANVSVNAVWQVPCARGGSRRK